LGRKQVETNLRISPRKLAELADVPKDFIYGLDTGKLQRHYFAILLCFIRRLTDAGWIEQEQHADYSETITMKRRISCGYTQKPA